LFRAKEENIFFPKLEISQKMAKMIVFHYFDPLNVDFERPLY